MALSANTPSYAFTNQFPNIPVSGTANTRLLVTLRMAGVVVLDKVIYQFDPDGMASLRHLGDLVEKYFYDQFYDIRRFSQSLVLTLESEGETIEKTFPVYFCRSYVGGEKLSPDMVRDRPLTACREKHTCPGAKEYLSFVSSSGGSVVADILYLSDAGTATKQITLQGASGGDTYTTADASPDVIQAAVGDGKVFYYDVYLSGHSDKVRYWMHRLKSFNPTSFVFQNGFGAVESFVCKGICKNEFSSERETGVIASHAVITSQTSLRSYTANTGALSSEEQESFISLLNSVSLMVLKDGSAFPVIVTGQNVSLANFRSKLASAEFTYSHSSRNLSVYKFNKGKGIFDFTFDNTFN